MSWDDIAHRRLQRPCTTWRATNTDQCELAKARSDAFTGSSSQNLLSVFVLFSLSLSVSLFLSLYLYMWTPCTISIIIIIISLSLSHWIQRISERMHAWHDDEKLYIKPVFVLVYKISSVLTASGAYTEFLIRGGQFDDQCDQLTVRSGSDNSFISHT